MSSRVLREKKVELRWMGVATWPLSRSRTRPAWTDRVDGPVASRLGKNPPSPVKTPRGIYHRAEGRTRRVAGNGIRISPGEGPRIRRRRAAGRHETLRA